jgi:hypothetical protein
VNLEFKSNVLSSDNTLEEAFYPVSASGMETTGYFSASVH